MCRLRSALSAAPEAPCDSAIFGTFLYLSATTCLPSTGWPRCSGEALTPTEEAVAIAQLADSRA
jgi:hypothetical protein